MSISIDVGLKLKIVKLQNVWPTLYIRRLYAFTCVSYVNCGLVYLILLTILYHSTIWQNAFQLRLVESHQENHTNKIKILLDEQYRSKTELDAEKYYSFDCW